MKAIEKQNIVDEVYHQMKEKILQNEWKPGEKIPSENDLCQSFQVSRVSVRSAIQKLRDIGLITTHQGKGSYVSEFVHKRWLENFHLIINLSEKEYLDMTEFRETVEFKCMELAVERATEEDIAEIKSALKKMIASKEDYIKYTNADFEFHLAIAKASNNIAFYTLMKQMKDVFHSFLGELNRVFGVTEESVQLHIQIFNFIQKGDADYAKSLMRKGMERDKKKVRSIVNLYDN